MKIFGIEVPELHAVENVSTWISAEKLDAMFADRQRLNLARHKAAQILWDARRRRRDILLRSRQQAALEQEREMIELRALLQQDTLQAIEESVVWLVDEQKMEAHIAATLQAKAVQWAADTLREWGGELDWDELIAVRIRELSRQQPDSGVLVLSCHPGSVSRIQELLGDELPLRIDVKTELEPGHAILENSLVRIDIDLKQQLELLAARLKEHVFSAGADRGFE
jgi:flagellar biosynthesis/type III secretory pathway protein FliH